MSEMLKRLLELEELPNTFDDWKVPACYFQHITAGTGAQVP